MVSKHSQNKRTNIAATILLGTPSYTAQRPHILLGESTLIASDDHLRTLKRYNKRRGYACRIMIVVRVLDELEDEMSFSGVEIFAQTEILSASEERGKR